jgi:uncharacterized repeat protein (TIGR01451 family)
MKAIPNLAVPAPRMRQRLGRWIAGLAAAWLLALAAGGASATPPPAGTSIGNQASATYTDASGISRTVTSNTVQTVVQQVAALTLTANGAKTAAVGGIVYYPHTVANTGNGTDTFTLAAANVAGSAFSMSGIAIYADNGSGQPTGSPITSTGALAAGAVFKLIVAGTVPATATSGQTNSMTVTATSTFNSAQTASDTDTTTVTNNAVISVTKAVSAPSGNPGSGTAYTYTLTYTNTGNNTATTVKITDAIPAGMAEVPNSGLWSVTGATTLTDAKATYGTAPNQLTYDYNVTTAGTVTAVLSNVAPGQSGTISFQVKVNAGTAAGIINNTANLSYNDGSGNTVTGSSNTVPFTVNKVGGVTLTAPVPTSSANPGSTVAFADTVTNNGNATDTFNITIAAGATAFPAGTTFMLYKSDGVTPLVDTNGDGIPDTGPVAAGTSYTVILKATLPSSAGGTGPFIENITATSTVDSTKSSTGADTVNAITAASVDVTNNAPIGGSGVLGVGPGPGSTPVVTNTTNPGTATAFIVYVNNTGPIADSYALSSTLSTPTGWTVAFKADGGSGNCSTFGAVMNSTAIIAAGGNALVCAVVTVPAGYAAGTANFYFKAQSAVTGANDTIFDAVTVNAMRSLTITPNNSGQASAGGTVIYSHTITNTGNVLEGNGTVSTIVLSSANSQSGWTSVQYYDAAGTGVYVSTDPVIPAAGLQAVLASGLAPGQSITIFDKVTAASGAANGVVDTTTLTLTTSNGTYTSAVPGNLTLVKAQGLDATCSGTPAGGYSGATITAGALPGACIDYQITVQNVGSTNATAVTVSDSTPSYTTLASKPVPATTLGTITAPAAGSSGSVSATVGTLTPGQSAVITFGVQIQQ